MAALNTLRTKGSILLTAVIGISLLAFLLGDGTSLFNQTTVVVGTVNDKEVILKDYATEVDLMSNIRQYMTGATSLTTQESEMVQTQVWNKFVADAALYPSMEKLGLQVSDEELLDMVNGVYISPVVMQIFTNQQSGAFDKEQLTQFVSNLDMDNTGRARSFWSFIETQSADNRMNEKLNTLIKNGMYVTSLQVDQALADNSNDYSIEYVTKAISSIADDAVKVTDQDLKDYYNKHIARFKYNDASEVEYITFDIMPSAEDFTEAEANASKIASELAESNEMEQYVNYTSEEKFDTRYYKQTDLPQYIQPQMEDAVVGKSFAPNFENNIYSIARVSDIKVMPDSATLRSVYVDPAKNIDSIINVIKAGGFDGVVASLSLTQGENAQEVAINTGDLAPQFSEKIINAKKGDVLTFDVQGAKQIVLVSSLGQPVKKYQIAKVVISVVPSSKTEQGIYAKATAFINEVKGGKTFEEALTNNQYIKRNATIENSSRNFAELDNSRELVRWSLTSAKGELSHVVTVANMNVIAFVKNKMERGTAPFEAVKEDIRPLYIAKAKMDLAVKELSGATSLEALAASNGTEVGTATDIKFSMSNIPGIGVAPEVVGALSSLKEGVISTGIPAGNNAAAVKITSKIATEGMDAAKAKVMLETTADAYLDMRISNAITEKVIVKDNRVIYY